MSNIDLSKVSANLTPKERAKLVITLQLKGLSKVGAEEINRFLNGEFIKKEAIPTQPDINVIIASCPSSEGAQYNFYINLKSLIWNEVADKMCSNLSRLDTLSGNLRALSYLISISPTIKYIIDEIEKFPVVVTKEEYEQGIKEAKEFERAAVLPLEGRCNLAEQEAYHYLLDEEQIKESSDYLDGYIDHINNFGKSEQDILAIKIQQIKKGVEDYKKEKERLGGDEPLFKSFAEYCDLREEELISRVNEDYKDELVVPSKEEYELWQKTVESERERLLKAVQEGKLLSKDNGIEAGSYYDWLERHQKFEGEEGSKEKDWHPLREKFMEMGYSNGKVTSGGQATEGWQQIAIATEHNSNLGIFGSPGFVKNQTGRVIDILKSMFPFEVLETDYASKKIMLKISKPEYEEMIISYVSQAHRLIQNTLNCIGLIKEVEAEYFDGMSLFSADPAEHNFSVEKIEKSLIEIVDTHNNLIEKTLKLFNKMAMGFWEFELVNKEKYSLSLDHELDKQWVNTQLQGLVQQANKT